MARPKKEGKKNIRKDISMDPEQYERLMNYCRQQDRPNYTIKLKVSEGERKCVIFARSMQM